MLNEYVPTSEELVNIFNGLVPTSRARVREAVKGGVVKFIVLIPRVTNCWEGEYKIGVSNSLAKAENKYTKGFTVTVAKANRLLLIHETAKKKLYEQQQEAKLTSVEWTSGFTMPYLNYEEKVKIITFLKLRKIPYRETEYGYKVTKKYKKLIRANNFNILEKYYNLREAV
jgi:hypothetical protein